MARSSISTSSSVSQRRTLPRFSGIAGIRRDGRRRGVQNEGIEASGKGRTDAFDPLQVLGGGENQAATAGGGDAPCQHRADARQQGQAVQSAAVDGQRRGQTRFWRPGGRRGHLRGTDQRIEPELVAPVTVRIDQQPGADQPATQQDHERQQNARAAASGQYTQAQCRRISVSWPVLRAPEVNSVRSPVRLRTPRLRCAPTRRKPRKRSWTVRAGS